METDNTNLNTQDLSLNNMAQNFSNLKDELSRIALIQLQLSLGHENVTNNLNSIIKKLERNLDDELNKLKEATLNIYNHNKYDLTDGSDLAICCYELTLITQNIVNLNNLINQYHSLSDLATNNTDNKIESHVFMNKFFDKPGKYK